MWLIIGRARIYGVMEWCFGVALWFGGVLTVFHLEWYGWLTVSTWTEMDTVVSDSNGVLIFVHFFPQSHKMFCFCKSCVAWLLS